MSPRPAPDTHAPAVDTAVDTRPAAGPAGRLRRCVAVLGVAMMLPLLPSAASSALADDAPPPAPASATPDEVAQENRAVNEAERDVAALQAQVEHTAAVLTEGTQRLVAGQQELVRLHGEQSLAQRAADAAVERAAAAKARVGIVVSAQYRFPVPDAMHLALTTGPDGIRDAVVARSDLDRVRGDSQDLLREATAARAEADGLLRRVAQLTAQAAEQERALAAEVESLRQTAQQSEQTLHLAHDALRAARASRQRAVDKATASAAAESSAKAALEAARTAARSNAVVLPTCSNAPVGRQANGFLDAAALCALDDAAGHALRPDAAAAFNALNAAHKAERGTPLCVTDSYRSYAAQVDVYARKPELAAVPGSSNHGWGLAVDFGCGVERFGSDAHTWMRANAGRFGWYHPAWAQAGGSRPEAWHWEFAAD